MRNSAKLNAWVTVGTDNTITILCPTSEMGQVVLTSLPLILAEELDADWSKVKCEFAPNNQRLYGGAHKMFPGAQVTLASVSGNQRAWFRVARTMLTRCFRALPLNLNLNLSPEASHRNPQTSHILPLNLSLNPPPSRRIFSTVY